MEKMSSVRDVNPNNIEVSNAYGSLRINRRQQLLEKQREEEEFLKFEAMTLQQEQTKQENETLKKELRTVKKGNSQRKKSCFEIALNMEILPNR